MSKYFKVTDANGKTPSGFEGYPVVAIDENYGSALHGTDMLADHRQYPKSTVESWVRKYKFSEITEREAMTLLGRKIDTRLNYQAQLRGPNGRFRSLKPKTLRRGSLYRAQRADNNQPVIGRYRADGFDNYLVFSEHKTPVVVKKETVQVLGEAEVKSYLGK